MEAESRTPLEAARQDYGAMRKHWCFTNAAAWIDNHAEKLMAEIARLEGRLREAGEESAKVWKMAEDAGFREAAAEARLAEVEQEACYHPDAVREKVHRARREALEESAKVADEQCRHVTRLCSLEHETLCRACNIAASIRALAALTPKEEEK